ncbi:hypothetical protein [Leptospira vanthielii]|uniref:Uncharacterized protein n=1 Tax=Leptospira vanthielii serovar Holland str. Waz Holland = ATCC 700522 TaxID=1218591 RepID=N1WEN2_9LEPT|nr:hypothetical protein [Leptospira vanthielii]EMY71672.1 hypothetical protein LEP1GSC199_0582 [Leptospira vanthielii serovar Holland str. Waz Holland = ATCC 700522]
MKKIFVHPLKGKVGDTIRLLHSAKQLYSKSQEQTKIAIYMHKSEAIKIQGLSIDERDILETRFGFIIINFSYAVIYGIPDYFLKSESNCLVRLAWIASICEKSYIKKINHVFTPENCSFSLKKIFFFNFQRIDKIDLTSKKIWDQTELIKRPKLRKIYRIIYFVRHHQTQPWRNSNLLIFQDLKKLLKYFPNYHLSIAGLANRSEYLQNGYPENENYIEYQMFDLYNDQKEIYKTYDLAIGVNSASLDIASIAGIPVLRLCEFQGLPKCGIAKYNSFLSVKTNIGIIPNEYENEHWYDQLTRRAFQKIASLILKSLTSDTESLTISKHILLNNAEILRAKNLKTLIRSKIADFA